MDEDPAGCERRISRKEIYSAKIFRAQKKKKNTKREVQRLQQKLRRTSIDFLNNISARHTYQTSSG